MEDDFFKLINNNTMHFKPELPTYFKSICQTFGFSPYQGSDHIFCRDIVKESFRFRIVLHALNDNHTTRVLISETDNFAYIDSIDLFETSDEQRIHRFINVVSQ
jgi:hypothetical protein